MVGTFVEKVREGKDVVVVVSVARISVNPRVIEILKFIREAHVCPEAVKYGMKRPKKWIIC